jgi:hypothetical protein
VIHDRLSVLCDGQAQRVARMRHLIRIKSARSLPVLDWADGRRTGRLSGRSWRASRSGANSDFPRRLRSCGLVVICGFVPGVVGFAAAVEH